MEPVEVLGVITFVVGVGVVFLAVLCFTGNSDDNEVGTH